MALRKLKTLIDLVSDSNVSATRCASARIGNRGPWSSAGAGDCRSGDRAVCEVAHGGNLLPLSLPGREALRRGG